MKDLTLNNIVTAVGGEYHGDRRFLTREISFVTSDSRSAGEGCLFAAIKGERTDGHSYIDKAAKQGAICALAQHIPCCCTMPVIVVDDTVRALGDLAAYYRSRLNVKILGITGSVGKTTAKEMAFSVLSQKYRVHKTSGNFNNELGVPLTLLGIDEQCELAVVEMGISHFGEMRRLGEIVRPDMALYTAVGSAHLEFLGDFDGVLRAKTEMLDFLPDDGTVFVNGDDATLQKLTCRQRLCRYGVAKDCDVRAENVRVLGTDGMELDIVAGQRRFAVKINSFGVHMVTAALGGAAVGIAAGIAAVYAVHIGADAAAAGIQRRRQRYGGGIAAAPPQRRQVTRAVDALKARDNNDLAGFQLPQDAASVQRRDLGGAVVAVGMDACLRPGERNGGQRHLLQGQRHQRRRGLFPGGQQLIRFPAAGRLRQLGSGLQQAVGGPALGGNHRDNMIAGGCGIGQLLCGTAQPGGIGDRGAAEFIDKEIHRVAPFRFDKSAKAIPLHFTLCVFARP